jgi:hypothetical protein
LRSLNTSILGIAAVIRPNPNHDAPEITTIDMERMVKNRIRRGDFTTQD